MMDKDLFEKYLRELRPLPTELQQRGSLSRPPACLLCDLYGTLFISGSGDINAASCNTGALAALQDLLGEYDLPGTAMQMMERLRAAVLKIHAQARRQGVVYPEVRIDLIWQSLLPFKDPVRIRHFATAFELILNPVWPMPHTHALIRACRNAGIILGIISNAQFFTLDLFPWFFRLPADQLGFDPRLMFFSFEHGEAKPSMKMFRLALGRLGQMGITPRQTAYIGNDLRNDILPAAEAGFQTILFAGDRRSLRLRQDDPACANLEPDLVVSDLKQLISCLVDGHEPGHQHLDSTGRKQ
jgi:putative hydrolase of the HAD superfamily